MSAVKSKAVQCWRLVGSVGDVPACSGLRIGSIVRFHGSPPTEAVWNHDTADWVPLRWEKCDDPTKATS